MQQILSCMVSVTLQEQDAWFFAMHSLDLDQEVFLQILKRKGCAFPSQVTSYSLAVAREKSNI